MNTLSEISMKVGFIGIGSMGAAMVPNLVKAGHQVSVWNRNANAAAALQNVTVLDSPAAAFQNDAVITMLADDKAVRSVIFDSGALRTARKDCIHVMTSTISLALVEELKDKHREAGIAYVAAPVFGVPAAAANAQLNIVVAGEDSAVAAVQPLFDVLGQKTWKLGTDPKRANVAKIAGNMMITLAIEAMGEASALTESHGVKAADFLDIVTNTLFASPSYKRYGGFIATNTYEPGFKLTLGLKDVNLAFEAAAEKDIALPAAQIVRENMLKAIEQGLGSKDWSILAKVARLRAGLKEGVA
jgi:3-hydroxyisobutyrate dehydrogenase-like beta-hydroxyacid dehydrogenase